MQLARKLEFYTMNEGKCVQMLHIEPFSNEPETLKVIPSAILYNDSFGITTTPDENGYFKIIVPNELINKQQLIQIDIVRQLNVIF